MFSQFIQWRGGGSLFIRAVDIRALRDVDDHCIIVFETTPGQIADMDVMGSALENMDRLKQEETEALIAAERARQAQQRVERGRQSMRMVNK